MTNSLFSIDGEATAMHVAKVMAEHQVTSILVSTDTSKPDIVTQDDVFTCRTVPLNDIQVKALLIHPTHHVTETFTCEDAIKIMIRRGCRKLIVTKNARNIGLFALTNILTNLPSTR
jgi:predicted transcriptional regulator